MAPIAVAAGRAQAEAGAEARRGCGDPHRIGMTLVQLSVGRLPAAQAAA